MVQRWAGARVCGTITVMIAVRCISLVLAAAALSSCAEVHRAGDTLQAWLRNYSWGTYQATPQQTRVAQQRATRHYAKVQPKKKTEMREKGARYLAVRTLDPSPQQLTEIKKKAATGGYGSRGGGYGGASRRTASSTPTPATVAATPDKDYKCVMIFDTYSKEIVGNKCYAVTELPQVGEVARFDTYTAEFIGPVEG